MGTLEAIALIVAAASAIAAILAAIFAGSQALAAGQQASYAQEQLALAEQVRKDQAQPYIFVDIAPDEHEPQKIMLIVKNTGMTLARNVRITLDPPLQSVARPTFTEQIGVLRKPISALPPGRRMRWFIDTGFQLLESEDAPRRYTVTVNADGPFGPVEELIYEIDLSNLLKSDASKSAFKTLNDEVRKCRAALEKIARTQK